ncbi:MAG: hypothetical protein JNG84_00410 [Archangium sp.]|nr:hypothetical protein [Archangium sp.]
MLTAMLVATVMTQGARVLFIAEQGTESDESDAVQVLFPWVCGVKKALAKGPACASSLPVKMQVSRLDGAKWETKGRKRMKPYCGADCVAQLAWTMGAPKRGDEEQPEVDEVPFETLLGTWPEQAVVFQLEEARAAPKLPKELTDKPPVWGRREPRPRDPEEGEPPVTIERFIFKVKPEPAYWQLISTHGAIAMKKPKEETWSWVLGGLEGEVKLVAATDLNGDNVPEVLIGQRGHESYSLTLLDLATPNTTFATWGVLEW